MPGMDKNILEYRIMHLLLNAKNGDHSMIFTFDPTTRACNMLSKNWTINRPGVSRHIS